MRTSFLFICFWVMRLSAQPNLLVDGGFEEYSQLPNGEAQGSFLLHWRNPNTGAPNFPNATPDFLHKKGTGDAQLPHSYYGTVNPHGGSGVAGLVLKSGVSEEFREYLVAPLAQPLAVGKTYQVSFFLTSGEEDFYSEYGSNGFGVRFSEEMPKQKEHEILRYLPQYEMKEVFFSTKWQKITFSFVADKPYQFCVLGCFLPDMDVQQRKNGIGEPAHGNQFTYVFIDDVSVKVMKTPKEKPPVDAVQPDVPTANSNPNFRLKKLPATSKAPTKIEDRQVQKQRTVLVTSDKIMIDLYDARAEDKDTVSLNFNGEWVVQQQMVMNRPMQVELTLREDANNMLIFYAHNLGNVPPNTAVVSFLDNGERKVIEVVSDLNKCGAIAFKRKK